MPPLFTFSSWGMWASAFSSLIWDSSLRVFNSLSTPARPVKNKNTLIKKTQWILINESKNKVYVVQTNEFFYNCKSHRTSSIQQLYDFYHL